MKNKFKKIYDNLQFVIKENFKFSLIILFLTIISSFTELLGITMVFPLIQSILNSGDNIIFSNYLIFFDNYEPKDKIKIILSIFVIIIIIKNLIRIFRSFLTLEYEYQIINQFQSRISKRMISNDYKSFTTINNNQLFNLLNKEIKTSIRSVRTFFNLLSDIIFFIFTLIFGLIVLENNLIITILLIFLISIPLAYLLVKFSYRNSTLRLKYSDLLAKEFRGLLDGLKIIKIFKLSNIFMSKLNDTLLKNLKIHRNFSFISENIRTFFEMVLVIIVFFVILFYFGQETKNNPNFSFALFTTLFLILFKIITSSIQSLRHCMYLINQSSSLGRLIDIYNQISQDLDGYKLKKKMNLKNNLDEKIEFKNLTFNYDEKSPIFNEVNLEIKSSDRVFINGISGSGKSTLVELLAGLNIPISGQILIDQTDLSNMNMDNWLSSIGFVGQKNFLFNKSIKKNIYDGDLNATELSYRKAIETSQTLDFLEKYNLSENDIINQNQDNLSGGQLKRISIARALIKNPQILILDEATNEFDELLEEKIINEIIKNYSGITIIFISHNLKIKKFCNRHFIINDNKILEQKL